MLITGSGPQNKNEELVGHKPFLVLSDHLTRAGYAVLRFDDRGVGKSTGDFKAATASDLASDAAAALAYLKIHPRITSDLAGYLGHSEGGYLAPMAHDKVRSDFQIYLAGPALPLIPDVMKRQGADILKSEGENAQKIAKDVAAIDDLVQILRSSSTPEEVYERLSVDLKKRNMTKKEIALGLDLWATPWAMEYAYHQPGQALKELNVPVLALYGEHDLQVAAEPNAEKMRHFLQHPQSETAILPGLNHLFQPTQTGRISEYMTIKTTVDPTALNKITSWLNDITSGPSNDL